jgi:putative SOS response-associated peptidase YedK
MDELVWGLLPHNANPASCPRPVHARAETVATLPIFADAFHRRRAIVPVDVVSGRGSIGENAGRKFNFARDDGDPMALAGLWESFVWPDGQIERSFCVITVATDEMMAPIHDRMPVVLERADWPLWLGEVGGDPTALLRPPAPGVLKFVSAGAARRGKGRGHV